MGLVKKIFCIKVNEYRPELCRYTTPTVRYWAALNGWEYIEINNRLFNGYPVTLEKMQVSGLIHGCDHAAVVDADIMIRPDFECPTKNQERGVVWASYGFKASDRFQGINGSGISGGFYGTSKESFKLWDLPNLNDAMAGVKENPHLIDEWCVAFNISKYNLIVNGVEHDPDAYIKHFGSELVHQNIDKGIEQARDLWNEWVTIWPEIKTYL